MGAQEREKEREWRDGTRLKWFCFLHPEVIFTQVKERQERTKTKWQRTGPPKWPGLFVITIFDKIF